MTAAGALGAGGAAADGAAGADGADGAIRSGGVTAVGSLGAGGGAVGGAIGAGGPIGSGGGTPWESVVAAIDTGDLDLVADRVLALDERARREVAAALPGHIPVAEERADARRQARENRRARESEAAWRDYVRAAERAGRTVYEHERRRWDAPWNSPSAPVPGESWAGPLRVAGAAAIGGAAAVVSWLYRRDLQDGWNDAAVPAVLERVLAARPAGWQADFATRAALKLRPAPRRRGGRDPMAGLVLAMLRRTGATPPEHDPLVVAWAGHPPIAATLREDRLLDHLLPRLFEAEGVGLALRDERADPPPPRSWLAALRKLESEGRIGRDLLLDGCLRRFLRGGQATDLRFFVRLHELLSPTYDEVIKRRHDYLRLLPAAPGVVAEAALKHLRRLEALDPGEVTEAVRALLSRGERKLLTAGLTWLDAVARDPGADLDELAPALGYAFACESADVQGRAVRMAVKHAKRFTPVGAQAIRDTIGILPQELGETLAAVFGGEAGEDQRDADGFTPSPLPEPHRAEPFPPPIRTAADLDPRPAVARWEAAELWLAGVVRLHGRDPEGLAARLAEGRPLPNPPARPWVELWQWCQEIARLVVPGAGAQEAGLAGRAAGRVVGGTAGGVAGRAAGAAAGGVAGRAAGGVGAGLGVGGSVGSRASSWLPQAGDVPGPHLFLLRRWAEVYDAISAGALPPYLLAEPTEATGHLDAGELVARLAGYERAGVEALPADLQQALLRLPREIAPEVVARAARLTSEAGRAVARWMGGGRPECVTEIAWCYYPPAGAPGYGDRHVYGDDREAGGTLVYELVPRLRVTPPVADGSLDSGLSDGGRPEVALPEVGLMRGEAPGGGLPDGEVPGGVVPDGEMPDGEVLGGGVPDGEAPGGGVSGAKLPGGLPLVWELLGGSAEHRLKEHGGYMHWWPYLMPSHREAVAAHLVPHLIERWLRARVQPPQASALALADGPAGEAVALVLAYFAADRSWSAVPEERARPLVEMAARGSLDAEQVGRQLALLIRRTELKPGPVFETLESAAALGAHREVWRVMTGFLAVFLPGPGERPHTRHTQGLVFALRAARWAEARGVPACVAEVAERRASNNFVREARRLHTYLT
ncbi:DUF6493 family protein [Nonomuraea sp. NPDC049709]|uniref:DUF6493 family protein n=1 Tax=Nonomuraea sp. NPDC049709 TaxID=3154736 RepID=UPI00342E1E01